MSEKVFNISPIDPVELYGVQDRKLKLISKYFPELKLVARGESIKVIGDEAQINEFEEKLGLLIQHLLKFKQLTSGNIERLMEDENDVASGHMEMDDEVIVHGNAGLVVKPRTVNQRKLAKEVSEKDLVFAVGPAGTGKTYIAVALAVRALKNKEVRRIILTRPAVEAGENLGFLPGDFREKLDPYLQPLYAALRDMIPAERLNDYLENGIVEIVPLAYMRGRTLDNAFVILDEAQNTTKSQLKMFLTRMGKSARFVINGDHTQIDLPNHQPSGLLTAMNVLKDVDGIGFVHFDSKDVIRHKLVKDIIEAYSKKENDSKKKSE